MMKIEASSTIKQVHLQNGVLECLHYIEDAGRFELDHQNQSGVTDCAEQLSNDKIQHVSENDTSLEDEWQHAYDQRKQHWKCCTIEDSCHSLSDKTSSPIPSQMSNINNDQSLRNAFTKKAGETISIPIVVHDPEKVVSKPPKVDINAMIHEFSLNTEQARAFLLIATHSTQNDKEPLHMFLGGAGGTGKSHVISTIQEFFKRRNEGHCFRLASYMGVAARNISGMTLHSCLMLNQWKARGNGGKSKRDLVAMWQNVDYLLIDEVSMIGCNFLLQISQALSEAKESSDLFGGLNIVFAGDFAQLPPVGQRGFI
jgi:hypothetical protein